MALIMTVYRFWLPARGEDVTLLFGLLVTTKSAMVTTVLMFQSKFDD